MFYCVLIHNALNRWLCVCCDTYSKERTMNFKNEQIDGINKITECFELF